MIGASRPGILYQRVVKQWPTQPYKVQVLLVAVVAITFGSPTLYGSHVLGVCRPPNYG